MSAVFDATAALAAPSVQIPDDTRRSPLTVGAGNRVIAFDGRGAISLQQFQREVRGLAATLPVADYAINLCEHRYRFLVAFCAAALRGQTTLLPPSRAPAVIDQVLARHPHSYCLGDAALDPPPPHYRPLPSPLPQLDGEALRLDDLMLDDLMLDDGMLVAIGFTSGSTGQPRPNPKTWGGFRASTAQNLAALADLLRDDTVTRVVATVPPQHMYGMEMSVLLPLLGPIAVHCARPFFPEDIARALAESPTPPLLVSTPVHLRALVHSQVSLPPLAGIVSATAPLPAELAGAAEARFGCEVRELFGSTETCVIARRRSAVESAWTPLPGVRLAPQPDGTAVQATHLPEPVVLADLIALREDGRFELCGRNADLIEIAGKRASLGDLTRKLLAVPGVLDGVVVQLGENQLGDDQLGKDQLGEDESDASGAGAGVRRIAALAVAPGLDAATIAAALRASLDPVFLPRPLRCVPALPRNGTGKLPRQALLAMLRDRHVPAEAPL